MKAHTQDLLKHHDDGWWTMICGCGKKFSGPSANDVYDKWKAHQG